MLENSLKPFFPATAYLNCLCPNCPNYTVQVVNLCDVKLCDVKLRHVKCFDVKLCFFARRPLVHVTWSCLFIILDEKVKICTEFSNWGDAHFTSETGEKTWNETT